jgi:hypothetical protein
MYRSFASTAVALTFLGVSAPVHADIALLNNLDQTPSASTYNPFYGQSFIAGTVNEPLQGATMLLDTAVAPSSSIKLEVEARNSDGTVGGTLFSDFSSSYDPTTHLVTFTVNSPFELMSGTGYWLVLSDKAGSGGRVGWQYTTSQTNSSQDGYTLPATNTAFVASGDNGSGNITYYQLSDGPQLFELTGASAPAVPEPSTALLAAFGAVAFLSYRWSRHRLERRQAAA